MKVNEIEAITTYLEFHLLQLVEQSEQHIADPDVIGDLYDRAYAMLDDFERTLVTQMMLDHASKEPNQNG